jgi:hypothetical protein
MKTIRILGAAATLLIMSTSNAASLSLEYVGNNNVVDGVVQAQVGDVLIFNVVMDFSDTFILNGVEVSSATLGGGFGVEFDPEILEYDSYLSSGIGDDLLRRDPDVSNGLLSDAGFGDVGGLTGPDVVAAITFVAAAQGNVTIGTLPGGFVTSEFVSAVDFVSFVPVDYLGIDVAVVPVPAAVWFMLSGVGCLLGFARKAK